MQDTIDGKTDTCTSWKIVLEAQDETRNIHKHRLRDSRCRNYPRESLKIVILPTEAYKLVEDDETSLSGNEYEKCVDL